MSDFNERFKEVTSDFPYIRFLSAKIDADRLKVVVSAVYQKERETDFSRNRERIIAAVKTILPPSIYVELSASPVRLISTEILRDCLELLHKESVFVFSSLEKDDVIISTGDNPFVKLCLPSAIAEYARSEKLDSRLADYLGARHFADFSVSFEEKEEDISKIKEVLASVVHKPKFSYERPEEGRRISPAGRSEAYGDLINRDASYIGDCISPDFAVLYGTMTDIKIMEYAPKKPAFENEKRKFVTFFLDDTTGKIRCVFFPGPKSQGAVKYFVDGANIIADGRLDYDTRLNDGSLQFRVRHFSTCERAEFEINKVVRLVDDDYRYVTPKKYLRHTQSSLYNANRKPLTDEPIVVFQTLTTSLNKYNPGEIMEIAGVKLQNGDIVETFSSLILPHSKPTEEELFAVGLMRADIAGKPAYEQVLPDFFKFFDGYALTAFPFERNLNVLKPYLEKLHIPMPSLVETTKYAAVPDLKRVRLKNTHRALPCAEAIAKFLANIT